MILSYVPQGLNDLELPSAVRQAHNTVRNILYSDLQATADADFQNLVETWNNPTGLINDGGWMTVGISELRPCGVDGCQHMYGEGYIGKLVIDDGKGHPVSAEEGSVSYDNNSIHILETHPDSETAQELARRIVGLHEHSAAYRQTHNQ